MIRKTFEVELTEAAWETLRANEGNAPPSKVELDCTRCGASGEVTAQVTAEGLTVEAPCEHLLQSVSPLDEPAPAFLVWGGRPGYSVLPLSVAGKMGWKFAQEEPGFIHVVARWENAVVGILLTDEAEALALTRPHHVACGEEPEVPENGDMLEFLRKRIRVALLDHSSGIAVFRPVEEEEV
jgi:hypothetical protein